MPQSMGGLTGSDLGGTALAGMGGAAGGGSAMGDTGAPAWRPPLPLATGATHLSACLHCLHDLPTASNPCWHVLSNIFQPQVCLPPTALQATMALLVVWQAAQQTFRAHGTAVGARLRRLA